MMKKTFCCLFITGFLLGGIFQQAQAQEKKLAFNFNLGFQTSSTFEAWHSRFILGAGLDLHLDKLIMISPEFQLWIHDFEIFSLIAKAQMSSPEVPGSKIILGSPVFFFPSISVMRISEAWSKRGAISLFNIVINIFMFDSMFCNNLS